MVKVGVGRRNKRGRGSSSRQRSRFCLSNPSRPRASPTRTQSRWFLVLSVCILLFAKIQCDAPFVGRKRRGRGRETLVLAGAAATPSPPPAPLSPNICDIAVSRSCRVSIVSLGNRLSGQSRVGAQQTKCCRTRRQAGRDRSTRLGPESQFEALVKLCKSQIALIWRRSWTYLPINEERPASRGEGGTLRSGSEAGDRDRRESRARPAGTPSKLGVVRSGVVTHSRSTGCGREEGGG